MFVHFAAESGCIISCIFCGAFAKHIYTQLVNLVWTCRSPTATNNELALYIVCLGVSEVPPCVEESCTLCQNHPLLVTEDSLCLTCHITGSIVLLSEMELVLS